MALIELHADLRQTAKQLTRIADLLERLMERHYGILPVDPKPARRTARLEDEVAYVDDDHEAGKELARAAGIKLDEDNELELEQQLEQADEENGRETDST